MAGSSEVKRIRLFSNGTEYMIWDDRNCGQCKKSALDYGKASPCELQNAMFDAELDDGSVVEPIAIRLGFILNGERPAGMITCTERELVNG